MSTSFKKPCSLVFLGNYKQNKTKKCMYTFTSLAKETACEKKLEKATLLELELLEVFVSLNKRPDFWKSLCEIMHIIFHCRTGIITSQENVCFHQKFVSKFTHTIIIVRECFLIFWFCIKENQVYYNWITYRLVLLVSIQLLFSRCIKYAETRGFLWSVFSRMWIESYPNTD